MGEEATGSATTITATTSSDPEAVAARRAETSEALLAAAPADAGAGALAGLKGAAEARFRTLGAPMPRDEYWKYLSPARFTRAGAAAAPAGAAPSATPSPYASAEPVTVAFVSGRFSPELSGDLAAAGVEIAPLGAGDRGGWAAEALGRLEARGQEPVARPLAALNGALATDGVAIRATGKATRPVEIRYLGETDGAVYLRHVVVLDADASLTLLESGIGAARFSTVLEVDVADGAAFDHVRLQRHGAVEDIATFLFARVGATSQMKSFTLTAADAGDVARNEAMIWLEGDEGSAHIAGAVIGTEKAAVDNTVFLTHDAVNCESRQVFKNVLADTATGVFQGKILVKEGAQQTDGYQISQSVLLDERAAFNAKPELEIYADDVKCSHGSTTGALDSSALFYLRARGVERRVAEAMLVEAFLEDALLEIADETLQDVAREAARADVATAAKTSTPTTP